MNIGNGWGGYYDPWYSGWYGGWYGGWYDPGFTARPAIGATVRPSVSAGVGVVSMPLLGPVLGLGSELLGTGYWGGGYWGLITIIMFHRIDINYIGSRTSAGQRSSLCKWEITYFGWK